MKNFIENCSVSRHASIFAFWVFLQKLSIGPILMRIHQCGVVKKHDSIWALMLINAFSRKFQQRNFDAGKIAKQIFECDFLTSQLFWIHLMNANDKNWGKTTLLRKQVDFYQLHTSKNCVAIHKTKIFQQSQNSLPNPWLRVITGT